MSSQPSSSKPIKFGDPNFEERLLQWYEDVDTDCSDKEDDVDESYAINSEHETDSEIECKFLYNFYSFALLIWY